MEIFLLHRAKKKKCKRLLGNVGNVILHVGPFKLSLVDHKKGNKLIVSLLPLQNSSPYIHLKRLRPHRPSSACEL